MGESPREHLIDLTPLPMPSVVGYQLVIQGAEEQGVLEQAHRLGKEFVQGHHMMPGSWLQHPSHSLSLS